MIYVLKGLDCGIVKEQLREREQSKHELEREIENKERELHAIRLDTQAVCFSIHVFKNKKIHMALLFCT